MYFVRCEGMGALAFLRGLAHFICRAGFKDECVKKFARAVRNKRILELGSGKPHRGRYPYSSRQLFDASNEFIQSDIVEEYGHKIVDVTRMRYKSEFDIILCTNVLEHVFDFSKAIENIYGGLKQGGVVLIYVPGFYPLHDEPNDYWRFTEHSLKRLLKKFRVLRLRHSGVRRYPFGYYAEGVK